MKHIAALAAFALALVTAPTARAQATYGSDQELVPRGAALTVGGGIAGFTDTEIQDVTNDLGAIWEARFAYGTDSLFALEAAYLGQSIGVDAIGLDNEAWLLGNGGEVTARLNFGIFRGLQPYMLAGLGAMRYELRNTGGVNTSNLADDDTVGLVPVAAGMNYRAGRFLVDLRGGIRASFNDDLVQDGDDSTTLSTWNTDLRIGFLF